MGKAILAAMVAVTLLGVAADGHAQSASRPGVTQHGRSNLPPPPRVQTPGLEQPTGPQPLFSLFGLPVYLSTPVSAPYRNSSLRTLGGQPQRSGDSIFQGAQAP